LKAISRSSLQKCETWRDEKLLEEINTERVKCRLCSKKKIIKTVYNQELNRIMKSKKSGAETRFVQAKTGVVR
jgi:hypothetical protein